MSLNFQVRLYLVQSVSLYSNCKHKICNLICSVFIYLSYSIHYLNTLFSLYLFVVKHLYCGLGKDIEEETKEKERKYPTTNTVDLGLTMHAKTRNSSKKVIIPDEFFYG